METIMVKMGEGEWQNVEPSTSMKLRILYLPNQKGLQKFCDYNPKNKRKKRKALI